MSAVTGHLMRRGAEFASAHLQASDKDDKDLSGGQIALLVLTALVILVALWTVRNTENTSNPWVLWVANRR